MSDPQPRRPDTRRPIDSADDHTAIDHLADELLPALIAKLGSTNLGEIEIRGADWRLRLRRPTPSGANYGRRSTDRASRAQPGHEGHGHAPATHDSHRAANQPTNGSQSPGLAAVGPGRGGEPRREPDAVDGAVATSPAVGVFQPAASLSAGTHVKSGDRLGVVEVLGVPHEVLAPADGIIGSALVEAGHAVEYGQELVRIDASGGRDAGDETAREARA